MTIREACQSLASIFRIPEPNKTDFVGLCSSVASQKESCLMYDGAGSCSTELQADAVLQAVATGKGGTIPGAGVITPPVDGGAGGVSPSGKSYAEMVLEIQDAEKPVEALQSKVGALITSGKHVLAAQLLQYFKKNVGEDQMFQEKSTPSQLKGFHSYLGAIASANPTLTTAIAEAKKAIEDAGVLGGGGRPSDSGWSFRASVSGRTALGGSGYPFHSDIEKAYFGGIQGQLGFLHKPWKGTSLVWGLYAQFGTLLAANVESIDYDDGGRVNKTITMPYFTVGAEIGAMIPISKDFDISILAFGGLGGYFMINNYQGLTASCDGNFCAADFANGMPMRGHVGAKLELGYKAFYGYAGIEGEFFSGEYQPHKKSMTDAMAMALLGMGFRL